MWQEDRVLVVLLWFLEMPGIGEVLALPALPEGGLGVLPESQVAADADMKEAGAVPHKPPQMVATQTKTIGMIHPPPDI